MSIYQILKIEDSFLKQISKEVINFDERIPKLVKNMIDTMINFNGVGLAACQIGIIKRVIVINYENKIFEIINPKIIFKEGSQFLKEGCLSIPNKIGIVNRFEKIIVKGQNKIGDKIKIKAEGFLSVILQHEIDHLDGILFIEKIKEII